MTPIATAMSPGPRSRAARPGAWVMPKRLGRRGVRSGQIGDEDRGARDESAANRSPAAPHAVVALRPLRLVQRAQHEAALVQQSHPVAERPVVLDVAGGASLVLLDVGRPVPVAAGDRE